MIAIEVGIKLLNAHYRLFYNNEKTGNFPKVRLSTLIGLTICLMYIYTLVYTLTMYTLILVVSWRTRMGVWSIMTYLMLRLYFTGITYWLGRHGSVLPVFAIFITAALSWVSDIMMEAHQYGSVGVKTCRFSSHASAEGKNTAMIGLDGPPHWRRQWGLWIYAHVCEAVSNFSGRHPKR